MRVFGGHKIAVLATVLLLPLPASAQLTRQVRSAWIDTMSGADWPGGKTDMQTQTVRMNALLDALADRGINSVFLQVQGRGDTAWPSAEQPQMSELFEPGADRLSYDVAQAWIDACHERGLDCIARVTTLSQGSESAARRYADSGRHASVSHPGLCVTYDGSIYLDPGNPETADYLLDVYRDLIYDYDFDGILFDGLYYPGDDFDDSRSQQLYKPSDMPVDRWRLANTEDCIDRLSQLVRIVRPRMQVYVTSPGIYYAPEGYGLDDAVTTYSQDAVAWLREGYADVVVPMMLHGDGEGFGDNLEQWASLLGERQLLPTLPVNVGTDPSVLMRHIDRVLALPGDVALGVSLTPLRGLLQPGVTEVLDIEFHDAAHLPYNPLGDEGEPDMPDDVRQEFDGATYKLTWQPVRISDGESPIRYYSVYMLDTDGREHEIVHATTSTHVDLPSMEPGLRFAVTATNRDNRTSDMADAVAPDEDLSGFDIEFAYNGGIVYINSATTIRRVDVHTLMGRNVLSRKINDNHVSIDFNGYDRGIYVLRVIRDDRAVALYKVVV